MPQLAQPTYLLLLLALIPFVFWLARRSRPSLPHPSLALFAHLSTGRARLAQHGGLVLRVLALLCLILALAQPRWPDLRTRIDTEGIAIVLVVDVSGSMAERDFEWEGQSISRLDAVKRVFRLFVAGGSEEGVRFEGRGSDLLGLVVFATRPEAVCPLTLSHQTLLRLLDAEEPRGVPGESETNISDALALGLARVRTATTRRQVLLLLTDGEHNQERTRSGWTPRQAAQVAAGLGIPIHTIDAGPPAALGADEAMRTAREQAAMTLREVASISGGTVFAARDSRALVDACRAIDRLERARIASFQYRRYHEAYPWFALAAFSSFVTAMLLERTLWRRLP